MTDVPAEKDTTMAEGTDSQYVVTRLLVPAQRSDYAIDLNGDNRVDNALGNIIGALASNGLMPQAGIDDSVAAGSVILLFSVKATSLTTASNVGVTMYLGKSMKMPDFSGTGMFTKDDSQKPADLFGKIASGKLTTNNPVTTKTPVAVSISLPLLGAGVDPLVLVVNGAHISMNVTKEGLMNGQLHGSIKNADIQEKIIPSVASLLSKQVEGCGGMAGADGGVKPADGGAADGGAGKMCTSTAMQVLQIFDTGGCANKDGSMAKIDGKIDVCEVATNSIITNVLAPDIQVYAADGSYKPAKDNAKKDSLSLGLGFEGKTGKY
ncbi:MAG: hypothetical protein EXR72_12465 [Myxococcales bacterium]|nr:hypothetical protein [Myxococcales bacterium]